MPEGSLVWPFGQKYEPAGGHHLVEDNIETGITVLDRKGSQLPVPHDLVQRFRSSDHIKRGRAVDSSLPPRRYAGGGEKWPCHMTTFMESIV